MSEQRDRIRRALQEDVPRADELHHRLELAEALRVNAPSLDDIEAVMAARDRAEGRECRNALDRALNKLRRQHRALARYREASGADSAG